MPAIDDEPAPQVSTPSDGSPSPRPSAMASNQSSPRELWTARQRGVLIALLVGLLALLIYRYATNPQFVADPQPAHPPREADLADRIDPNTADADTLAALPMIGPKRAADIVEHRERFLGNHPNSVAFTRLEDLLRIKGFGQATITTLAPYLIFPMGKEKSHPTQP